MGEINVLLYPLGHNGDGLGVIKANKISTISNDDFALIDGGGRAIPTDLYTVTQWACNAKRIKGKSTRLVVTSGGITREGSKTDYLDAKTNFICPLSITTVNTGYEAYWAPYLSKQQYGIDLGQFTGSGDATFANPSFFYPEMIRPFLYGGDLFFEAPYSPTYDIEYSFNGTEIEQIVYYPLGSSTKNQLTVNYKIEDTFY